MSRFDALLFDLDGVVYVGAAPVPHAAESIAAARAAGLACGYVTNNASRSASAVAEHLLDLGIDATIDDVITSPQAAVSLLPDYVPAGSRVLVIGGSGIDDALVAAGYLPVRTLADGPAAVMQGFSPDVSWRDLAEATFAVRSGLPWIATNPDLTFPAPGGIAPGNGALVRLVAETVGRGPDAVAGKPEPPLLREAVRRTAGAAPTDGGRSTRHRHRRRDADRHPEPPGLHRRHDAGASCSQPCPTNGPSTWVPTFACSGRPTPTS